MKFAYFILSVLILGTFVNSEIVLNTQKLGDDKEEVLKIFEGVMQGLIDNIPDIDQCVVGSEGSAKDFYEAIMKIKAGGSKNILDGIDLLVKGVEMLPDIMRNCNASKADIQKIEDVIKTYKNPKTFIFHIGKDILINGKNIYKQVMDAISSYESQNWFKFGEDIGEILEEVFIGSLDSVTNELGDEKEEVLKIFEGVMYGIIHEVPDIDQCVVGTEGSAKDFYEAIMKIKAGGSKNILDGIDLLVKGVEEIPNIMRNCNASEADIKKIEKIIQTYKNPKTFIFHVGKDILINGKNIFSQVMDAISAYENQSWFRFGQDIGEILEEVFIGSLDEQPTNDATTTTTGEFAVSDRDRDSQTFQDTITFMESYIQGITNNMYSLESCAGDVSVIGDNIHQAAANFATGTSESIETALKQMGKATQLIPASIAQCMLPQNNIDQIQKTSQALAGKWSFEYVEGQSLLVNKIDIYDDIQVAVADYNAEDWSSIGIALGYGFQVVFFGAPEDQLPSNAIVENTVDKQAVIEFIEGFLFGITGRAPGHLGQCVQDVGNAGTLIFEAVKNFQEKGAKNIEEGIREIGQAVEAMPDTIEACTQSKDTILQLEKLIKSIKSPWSFVCTVGKSILINGQDIFKDITSAVSAYKTGDFEAFGKDCGEAFYLAFLSNEGVNQVISVISDQLTTPTSIEVAEVVEGILLGFTKTSPGSLGECLQVSDDIANKILLVIRLFKQGGAENTKSAIMNIGEVIKAIPNMMTTCQASSETFDDLKKFISSFQSGWSYAFYVGKDILINGKNIANDIANAITDYQNQNYKGFGDDIGSALYEVLVGKN